MARLLQIKQKFERLNTDAVIDKTMDESLPDFVEMQKDQLSQGINQKGQGIGKYKDPYYADVKHSMNPLPGVGNVDLKYTGAFYQGLQAAIVGESIVIESTDSKASELEAKYGPIYGMDAESKRMMREKIRPRFYRNIKQALK